LNNGLIYKSLAFVLKDRFLEAQAINTIVFIRSG